MGPVGRVPVAVGRNPALLGWESHRSSQLPQPQQQGCGVGVPEPHVLLWQRLLKPPGLALCPTTPSTPPSPLRSPPAELLPFGHEINLSRTGHGCTAPGPFVGQPSPTPHPRHPP